MVCNTGHEDNPLRDLQLEQKRAAKNQAAAAKIEEFFVGIVDRDKVTLLSIIDNHNATKIYLNCGESNLHICHRGHLIIVQSTQIGSIERQFDAWRKKEMTHARVYRF